MGRYVRPGKKRPCYFSYFFQEAITIASSHLNNPAVGAGAVVQEALNRGSLDNLSAIMIRLPTVTTTTVTQAPAADKPVSVEVEEESIF